jgi:hypothetical protein
MGTGWIDAVMQANADIVAAEARLGDQVALLVEVSGRGEDTTWDEALLTSYMTSLTLRRAIRDRLLDGVGISP